MSTNTPYLSTIITAAGLVGGAYCAYSIYQHVNKKRLPENYTQVGKIKNIYTYPIKSCGLVSVDDAECTLMGLRDSWLRDRVLMVVDSKKNFISARGYPEMLLIRPKIKGSVLTLTHQDMESVSVDLAEVIKLKKQTTAYVWSTPVPVYDCGWEVSEWFSRLLLRNTNALQLMYYASENCREIRDNANTMFNFTKNDTGALPDETSFNMINEASVEDLNNRLTKKVSHHSFRPNFVLEGAKAFDEDNWKYVKIGENVFEIIKPCVRCILTTIDPETGIRDAKTEPLETLKSYRQADDPEMRKTVGSSPRMGMQMALRSGPGGRVKVNDIVSVA